MNENVRRANFALFRQMIAGEEDEVRRRILEQALDDEEARFEAQLRGDIEPPEMEKQRA